MSGDMLRGEVSNKLEVMFYSTETSSTPLLSYTEGQQQLSIAVTNQPEKYPGMPPAVVQT